MFLNSIHSCFYIVRRDFIPVNVQNLHNLYSKMLRWIDFASVIPSIIFTRAICTFYLYIKIHNHLLLSHIISNKHRMQRVSFDVCHKFVLMRITLITEYWHCSAQLLILIIQPLDHRVWHHEKLPLPDLSCVPEAPPLSRLCLTGTDLPIQSQEKTWFSNIFGFKFPHPRTRLRQSSI